LKFKTGQQNLLAGFFSGKNMALIQQGQVLLWVLRLSVTKGYLKD